MNHRVPCTILSLFLAGCGAFGSSNSGVQVVTLAAVGTSGETGSTTLTDLGNSTTQVTVTTTGGTDTGVQTAVINTGACGTADTIYALLNNVQSGQSITTIMSPLSMLTGSKYSVAIHKSNDIYTVEACGVIQ